MTKTGRYYLVEAGSITEGPRRMVGGWRDTSNLECYNDIELAAFGWLPEYESRATLGANETYNTPVTLIQVDRVILNYPARAMTSEEIRAADLDNAVATDSLLALWKAKTNAQFSSDFDALTTANKLEVLKRVFRVVLRRVL